MGFFSKAVLLPDAMDLITPFPVQTLIVSTVTKRRALVWCVNLVTMVKGVSKVSCLYLNCFILAFITLYVGQLAVQN